MAKKAFKSIYIRLNILFVLLLVTVILIISLIFREVVREFMFEINENRSKFTLMTIKNEILLSENAGISIDTLLNQIVKRSVEEHVLMLIANGKISNIVGKIEESEKSLALAFALFSEKDISVDVKGIGPNIKLIGAIKLDNSRILLMISHSKLIKEKFFYFFFFFTLFIIFIIFLAVFIFSQKLFKPVIKKLKKLEDAIRLYKSGDNTVRISVSRDKEDEFDLAFNEFNEMTDIIENLKKQLTDKLEWEKSLLSSLAHDMNTPITILRGYSENLMEHVEQMSSKDVKKICIALLTQSLYLQSLVDDLLTLANAKISRLGIKCEEIALDPFLDSLIDTFSPLAMDKGIIITGDADGINLWADPVRLRQIMSNLIRNAIIYADGTSYIEIRAEISENGVLINVRDDGKGLPSEIIPVIFEDKTEIKREKIKGWGLGLRIVKMLAGLHNGWCGYVKEEKGAHFQIWFPFK